MPIIEIKDDEHWHQLRAKHGGSSESGALFGYGYTDLPSKWSLWAIHAGKMATPDLDDDDRVWMGKEIEPVIARMVVRKMGWDLIEKKIYVTHPNPDIKMGSTVDRYIVEHEDGPGICELKNRDFLRWVDDYTEEDASIRDRIQLAHQFCCHPEATWGAVGVLVGGTELKIYKYKREDLAEMMADIEAGWVDLWRRVAEDDEPELTDGELPNWLRVHQERLREETASLTIEDGSFDDMVEAFQIADVLAKENEKIAKKLKASIVQKLDTHPMARSNRFSVRAKYVEVADTILPVTKGFMKALLYSLEFAGNNGDGETCGVINTIIKDGGIKARKGHSRILLKFDDSPMPTRDPEAAAAEHRAKNKPSAAELKAGMDMQAPYKGGE